MKGCLEDETRYNGFRDLVDTVTLYRGRGDQAQEAGEFKVGTHDPYSQTVHHISSRFTEKEDNDLRPRKPRRLRIY